MDCFEVVRIQISWLQILELEFTFKLCLNWSNFLNSNDSSLKKEPEIYFILNFLSYKFQIILRFSSGNKKKPSSIVR